jgi:hypothetical protein
MQCKDIPDGPILDFLTRIPPYEDGTPRSWATSYWSEDFKPDSSVGNAMPAGTPQKLIIAKMRQMIRRGVVDGCTCGCRGDFEITDKGRAEITTATTSSA